MMQSFNELFLAQGSKEWLEARRNHITATEVAHLYTGLTSIYTTVLEKRNPKLVKDISNVPSVREGSEKERLIRLEIEKHFPQLLAEDEAFLPQPCCESIEEPFFMASLDGYSKRCGVIVEIKNVYSKSDARWQDLLENGLKAETPTKYGYEYQVQWQLMVTKARMALLCFHHSTDPVEIEPKNIRIFKIKPDPKIQEELKKIGYAIKDIMVNNKTVEPGPGDTVVIEPTHDVNDLINIYRKHEKEYNELSERLEKIKAIRRQVIGFLDTMLLTENKTRVTTDSFTLTKSFRDGGYDIQRLIADKIIDEDVLEKYRKPASSSCRLTLK